MKEEGVLGLEEDHKAGDGALVFAEEETPSSEGAAPTAPDSQENVPVVPLTDVSEGEGEVMEAPPVMDLRTYSLMGWGALVGAMLNLPFISWQNGFGWNDHFLVVLFGNGLSMFITFFHEIGHTVAGWFYGYVTLPSFDFQHGGGMAWMVTDQLILLNIGLYAGLLYLWQILDGHRKLRIGVVLLALFHVSTAYTDFHRSVFDFMGPAFEVLIASFFLYRAWFDLAPRGDVERFLNAMFGSAMIFHVMIDGWGLLHNSAARQAYYTQKGTHGFGDFDKIADSLGYGFQNVVWVWLVLAAVCAVLPYLWYLKNRSMS